MRSKIWTQRSLSTTSNTDGTYEYSAVPRSHGCECFGKFRCARTCSSRDRHLRRDVLRCGWTHARDRIAYGLCAQLRQVRQLILRQGMMLAGIGLILGLAVVFVLARFLTSMLYGVSPRDRTSVV